MHNNLWQFLFNLIGKVNRDSYSSLSLEGKCQYFTEYIVCFKALRSCDQHQLGDEQTC